MKKLALLTLFIMLFAFAATAETTYKYNAVGQAPIDEAFYALGDTRNTYDPYSIKNILVGKELAPALKADGAKGKRNAAYAWGVTEIGNEIWFGTLNTGWCGWMNQHLRLPYVDAMNFVTNKQICGGGRSSQLYVYNVTTGDITTIKPSEQDPEYSELYSETEGINVRAAGNFGGVVFFGAMKSEDMMTPKQKDYVVLIAFDVATKKYLGHRKFPYNTIRRLNVVTHPDGSQALYTFMGPDVTTMQKGQVRSAMLRWVGTRSNPFGGGDVDYDGKQLTGFETVYTFDIREGAGGEFVQHTDEKGATRIIVSTWAGVQESIDFFYPGSDIKPNAGALFISKPMPSNGFRKDNQPDFYPVLRMEDFDADPVVAKGYEMGAMTLFGKYLYWGTMHVGTTAGYKHYMKKYENLKDYVPDFTGIPPEYIAAIPPSTYDYMPQKYNNKYNITFANEALENTWRAAAIFRTDLSNIANVDVVENPNAYRDYGKTETDLVYGQTHQMVLDESTVPAGTTGGATWIKTKNKLGVDAMYESIGIGNPMNVYLWTMRLHNNKLYFGTFDLFGGMKDYTDNAYVQNGHDKRYPIRDASDNIVQGEYLRPAMLRLADMTSRWAAENPTVYNDVSGADLFVIEDAEVGYAKPITINGFENEGNNGVRNSAVINGELYFGTSTYSATDDETTGTRGGYEYYKVSDGSPVIPPYIPHSSDSSGCSAGNGSDFGLAALLIIALICIMFNFRRVGGNK